MAKLEELRNEEEQANIILEQAQKDAQKIRLSIPEMLDRMSDELDTRLVEALHESEAAVEESIGKLNIELNDETDRKLDFLRKHKDKLESEATRRLRRHILENG